VRISLALMLVDGLSDRFKKVEEESNRGDQRCTYEWLRSMISVKNNYETDITKKTAARQDFMPWLALLQTAIRKIPERLQLMRDMLRFEREHRIKAEVQVKTLARQQVERYSQQDRLLLPAQ
jgi:hypothetical protein